MLDDQLASALSAAGFTGTIETQLEPKLGRDINRRLADLGRLLFFDKIQSLHATAHVSREVSRYFT
jgi:cytochrome c peroxidase